MIPHKLELKNFLSYGEPVQTIDFRHHTLICLSGKNGNGKSALLDALTWAVWGQARKVGSSGKADEGLLRLGTTRMMVSFEFEVNGTIYRVRREFAKTYGRPYAALDCEVYDAIADKFMSLTDKTTRATQEKIETIVGIDFETFINSAFLRQGQANEFSKKTAKDRKQILATILGLSHYDNLAQLALDQVRTLTDEKKILTHQHDQWQLECSQEQTLIAAIIQEKESLANVGLHIASTTQRLKLLETEHHSVKQHLLQREQQEEERTKLATARQEKHVALRNMIKEWKKAHTSLLNHVSIPELEAEKQPLDQQVQRLIKQKQEALTVQESLLTVKEQSALRLANLKETSDGLIIKQQLTVQRLELTQKQIQTRLNEKESLAKTIEKKLVETTKEQNATQTIIQQAAHLETEMLVIKTQFEKRKAFYQSLVQKGNWLKSTLTEIDQKKNTIHTTHNPSCPLCEQVLTVKRKQFLQNQMCVQETLLLNRIGRIGAIIRKLKDILYAQHQELERYILETQRINEQKNLLDGHTKQSKLLEQEQAAIDLEIVTLHEQAIMNEKELSEAQTMLDRLQKEAATILATDHVLIELQNKIAVLEQQRATTLFDQQHFGSLTSHIALLNQKIMAARTTTQQQDLQKKCRHSISLACRELKMLNQQCAAIETWLLTSSVTAESLATIQQSIASLQSSIGQLTQQKDNHLQTLGQYENALARLQNLQKQVAETAEKMAFLGEHIDDYQTLTQAFNKNGIQALLIEQAIPEIEAEANELLSKLTDNQSHIFIESLKDLKSGGVKETLDIHISDTAGIRPYEMFSRGEAFRVDFAIRIAISKLLARRAGTSLQTLIIDEGFGSQDEEGLAHIMDALYAIQKDFAKIIVVSHLTEFKDNFPVHFIVEKSSLGSTVNVQERG
jgi:exonuclease SbcC